MSCLVEKFKYYINLTDREESLLTRLEDPIEHYAKGKVVYGQNNKIEDIYIVKEGWLVSYSTLENSSRMVLNIHFPGDIVGAMALPFASAPNGLLTCTTATLCPMPKSAMTTILKDYPRLTALIFAIGMQDNVVLLDRLRAVSRMPGEERILLLLLQILTRQKITNPKLTNSFKLPISQEIIGDATGLTAVYVNRMLQKLQQDDVLEYGGRQITLKDLDTLFKRCEFVDRYYQLDTSWYPN